MNIVENPQILKKLDPNKLHIITFGGCGEFGMNVTGYYFERKLFLVDCGGMFADSRKLGIDYLVTDLEPYLEATEGVFSYLITHGHEDHIGALPYFVRRWPAPIYATEWTMQLIDRKFEQHGIKDPLVMQIVKAGDRTTAENFICEWVHVNHSIPMSCSLSLKFRDFHVFHSGDFKIDFSSELEPAIDLKRMHELGNDGIDLFVGDSTNAHRPGFGASEKSVFEPMKKIVKQSQGKVLVSTFSSNFWRLKTLVDVAGATGRKVYLAGRGLETTFSIAHEVGIDVFDKSLVIDESELLHTPDEQLLVLATGCQGEPMAALPRIAYGDHKKIKLKEGDTVVFSSRIIPGNERSVFSLASQLEKTGVKVITTKDDPAVHVSGHAHAGELQTLLSALRPSSYLPVHGTFSHLLAARQLCDRFNIGGQNLSPAENGSVFHLNKQGLNLVANLGIKSRFYDSFSKVPLTYEVMRQRLRVGEFGMALVLGVLNVQHRTWDISPNVEFFGLALPEAIDPEKWHENLRDEIIQSVLEASERQALSSEDVNENVRILVRRRLFSSLGKKPIVHSRIACLIPEDGRT